MTRDIEHLLKPRYEVIADYPNCKFDVGVIVQFDNIYPYSGFSYAIDHEIVHTEYFDKYPHIFRKLEWFEKRGINDMPKFLSHRTVSKVVVKVDRWSTNYDTFLSEACEKTSNLKHSKHWLPATEQQYTYYVNSINQK